MNSLIEIKIKIFQKSSINFYLVSFISASPFKMEKES